MLKKIIVLCFVLCLAVSSAQALLKVGVLGASYTYSGSNVTALGIEIEAPILPIPLITSRIEVTSLAGSNYTLMPILITGSYKFPLTPVYLGGGAGLVLYRRTDVSLAAPTALAYNLFIGYEQGFLPLASYFIQVGYDTIKVDNPVTAGTLVDFSGVSLKGGVRFGI